MSANPPKRIRSSSPQTFSYDGANRLTSDGTRAFGWDGADRLTARGADQFSYDPLSRLTAATVGGITRTYGYDGDGLLRSRTQGTTTMALVYDSSLAPAPLLQAGAERLVYGLGPLYQVHADGSYDTLVRDGLGSVRLTVSSAGAISSGLDYTAYGALTAHAFGTPQLLGFAGELQDPSGLIYLRARWYDPVSGRFITRDPFAGDATGPSTLNCWGGRRCGRVRGWPRGRESHHRATGVLGSELGRGGTGRSAWSSHGKLRTGRTNTGEGALERRSVRDE